LSDVPARCFSCSRPKKVDLEADAIVSETLAGIGIDVASLLADAPTKAPAGAMGMVAEVEPEPAAADDAFADLDARFAALS